MKALTAALTAAALLMAGSAIASEELAKKNACIGCHDMSAKKVGPTWKDIAAKVKGAKAEDVAKTIVAGGKGKYGKIPMPPQPKAEADSMALAKWILSL